MKLLRLTALTLCGLLAALLVGEAQITIPYTFTTGTSISSSQVNANFSALGAGACNLIGCTFTGTVQTQTIKPSASATYDIGSSIAKYANLYLSGTTSLNSLTYTWPSAQTAGAILQNNGSGTLSWTQAVNAGCGLRLTLTSGTPVTTSDVTAATNVYVTPVNGGQCSFYDGTSWTSLQNAEVTVAVPASTSQMYDMFCYNNSGTIACESLAWTNDTTRATALVLQNGVYLKTGATTRRYIGSFRTTTVSGQTEDSLAKRYVYSYYNRVRRQVKRTDPANTWAYTTATMRQANANTANQIDVVQGVAESAIDITLALYVANSGGGLNLGAAIGEDSTTTPSANQYGAAFLTVTAAFANINQALNARLVVVPAVGRHFYAHLEYSQAAGTTTWNMTDPLVANNQRGGLIGVWEN